MKHYEMAEGNEPKEIALATQAALLLAMRKMFSEMEKDIKQPGLTWAQLDFIMVEWSKKKPEIHIQMETM